MKQPVTIIGGGLAGLALGIGLRQCGVPVMVWEASHYPRHKVCGEFICGRGVETLRRWGLLEKMLAAGARWASNAAFFVGNQYPTMHALMPPAVCVSRWELDAFMADELRRLGGELRERQRWTGDFLQSGVVRATGHRVEPTADGWRWFGLKVYARNVTLAADLEMHLGDNGYVGLCRLHDRVNICGLFRTREAIHDLRRQWRQHLAGAGARFLSERLLDAKYDESSFCAVSGLALSPRSLAGDGEFVVGDALTMIAPMTGNGMSMALEAAEIAVEPLVRYSDGAMDWEETRLGMDKLYAARFAPRLAIASHLQRWMFQPATKWLLWQACKTYPITMRWLFAHTR